MNLYLLISAKKGTCKYFFCRRGGTNFVAIFDFFAMLHASPKHTHTHTHTNTLTHPRTQSHSQTHTHKHTYTPTYTVTFTNTHTQTHTTSRTHTLSLSILHTHTQMVDASKLPRESFSFLLLVRIVSRQVHSLEK